MITVHVHAALVSLARAVALASGAVQADYVCTNDLPEGSR